MKDWVKNLWQEKNLTRSESKAVKADIRRSLAGVHKRLVKKG